jgi:hypothetical protein
LNPIVRPFPIENRTWIQSASLGLRTPITGPLGVVANKYDWPVPSGRPFPVENRFFTESLTYIIGKDLLPNRQQDWPVPKGRQNPTENLTYTENVLYIRGSDRFFGLAGKPQFDWPNPRGREHANSLRTWTQSLNTTTLPPPIVGPLGILFFQTDWPVPKGREFPNENRTYLENLTYIIGKDALPNRQQDWPVPKGREFPVVLRGWSENLTRLIGLDSLKIRQFDWPNPRGPAFPTSERSFWQTLLQTTLKPVIPGPLGILFNQYDWPVPKAAPNPAYLRAFWDDTFPQLPPMPPAAPLGRTSRSILAAKDAALTYRERWDFISMLSPGETISSATLSAVLYSGLTDDATTLFFGSPATSGSIVTQTLTGGTPGQVYLLKCDVTASSGNEYTIFSLLSVLSSLQ